jgi:acyl-coenzyme A synthetase/AMP-(fatty) acid ligase
MDRYTLATLKGIFQKSEIFLMYGFTEAFRSTYLDPAEVNRRPDSIGKAIPNAEILVLREDGTFCAPEEVGELVQRGALVAQGYWGDPEATKKCFRPLSNPVRDVCLDEVAAWSGDLVRIDREGFLYFVGRRDEMIKCSGYRISPEEIETILSETGLIAEACVVGASHPDLGQAVIAIVVPRAGTTLESNALLEEWHKQLPPYMIPKKIVQSQSLKRNANGKIDRKHYIEMFRMEFSDATTLPSNK